MKIATWNVNSVRFRLKIVQQFIETYQPDVICLQETKVIDSLFPEEFFTLLGYPYLVFTGEKSYNGVAIISKHPIESHFLLKLYNQDQRHIAAQIQGLEIHNFYVPAGGDIPDILLNPKFKHKIEYIQSMKNWFINNRKITDKIIVTGDLNVAPHEHDVWSSKQLKNTVSHTGLERTQLLDLQSSLTFIDSARHFISLTEKFYTWWSYRNIDWKKSNRGRRLDHIWASNSLLNHLESIEAIDLARSWVSPSDHVPYLLKLNL